MATINFLKELLKHLIAKRKTQVYYWRKGNSQPRHSQIETTRTLKAIVTPTPAKKNYKSTKSLIQKQIKIVQFEKTSI